VLACADGFSITAEEGARVRFIDPDAQGRPAGAVLEGRALLVETPPGRPGRFQIRTPHAIASVRGTVWAVDATSGRTSVFVERGEVAVARPRSRGVVLRAGEGVDVDAGSGPLEVKRWSPERAASLLKRLGR
jgi:ferric-dicitrate binding protein FerR (iron transport regulator)